MLQAARFSLFSASAPRISPSRSRPADLPFELTCENAWKVHGSPGVYCGLAFERLSQQAIGSDGLGAATEKGCEVGIESDSARESPCSPPPHTICTPEPHFPSFHSPNRSMARHRSTVLNGRASYRRQISGESVEHRKVKAISESFAVALPRCATLLDSPHHAPSLQEHSGWKRTTQGMEILSHTHQRGQTLRSLTES